MTNIVVLIKQVPDTYSERKLSDGDYTLDREAADAVLDEINEKAVEQALQIKEANGGEVTVLCAGPDRATEAIRKALSMGADKAVHLNDEALHGSDVVQTAWAIANVLGTIEGTELVVCGNEAPAGRMGAVPAIIAEYLGLPQLTHMRTLEISGDTVKGERETDEGLFEVEATLPCVVSVGEKINEPRFPSFKGIMAAKKKTPEVLTIADLGIEDGVLGVANSGSSVSPQAAAQRRREGGRRGRGRQRRRQVPRGAEAHLTRAHPTDSHQFLSRRTHHG